MEYSWRADDAPFYVEMARRYAGPGGSVLELAAGEGRVTVPMLEAGFRVTALDSAPEMLARLAGRVSGYSKVDRDRLEMVEGDMRTFSFDRLWRLIYLPFNTLLILAHPQHRFKVLDRVREHLAPSGAFAFDIFTPDPARLVEEPDWVVELDHEAVDPEVRGPVHVVRERRRTFDFGRQVMHVYWRHTISSGGTTLARWEDDVDIAYVFPNELDLVLERQGFKITERFGGPDLRPYNPTSGDQQPQFVVATVAP